MYKLGCTSVAACVPIHHGTISMTRFEKLRYLKTEWTIVAVEGVGCGVWGTPLTVWGFLTAGVQAG